MQVRRCHFSSVTAAATLLLVCSGAATAAGYTVEDARKGPARGESRNVSGGAEVRLSDRRIGPSLIERLDQKLDAVPAQDGGPGLVRVAKAEAAMFIENAFAFPGTASLSPAIRDIATNHFPDELTVLRDASPTARRSYRVVIAGDVDGRAFSASSEIAFRGTERPKHLKRAIEAALADATQQIAGG
jgi:hypothetical protein